MHLNVAQHNLLFRSSETRLSSLKLCVFFPRLHIGAGLPTGGVTEAKRSQSASTSGTRWRSPGTFDQPCTSTLFLDARSDVIRGEHLCTRSAFGGPNLRCVKAPPLFSRPLGQSVKSLPRRCTVLKRPHFKPVYIWNTQGLLAPLPSLNNPKQMKYNAHNTKYVSLMSLFV